VAALAVVAACGGGASDEDYAAVTEQGDAASWTASVAGAPTSPRAPTIVLDSGHGGEEVGAAAHGVVEKDSNLDMALRIERLLQEAGVRVVLTRRDDQRVAVREGASSSFGATRFDLQARIDTANTEGADLFVSIHSNGSPDPGESGVEVWFDPNRDFGAQNRALAETILTNVIAQLDAYGYPAVNRGIKDDTCFRQRFGRCFPLFLLGPPRTTTREDLVRRGLNPEILGMAPGEAAITTRATQMPGALVELLFISNAADAVVLADEAARDAMARGVANALLSILPQAEPRR
jgi:N-acetylmuramoyl-L-alanine amidase